MRVNAATVAGGDQELLAGIGKQSAPATVAVVPSHLAQITSVDVVLRLTISTFARGA